MFTVNVGDRRYRVVFKHTKAGTECSIQQIVDGEHREIAWGQSIRNPLDTPCKAIGRKIALTRALAFFENGGPIPLFEKSERRQIWDAYFDKLRDSRRANLVTL